MHEGYYPNPINGLLGFTAVVGLALGVYNAFKVIQLTEDFGSVRSQIYGIQNAIDGLVADLESTSLSDLIDD